MHLCFVSKWMILNKDQQNENACPKEAFNSSAECEIQTVFWATSAAFLRELSGKKANAHR